jgi:pyruvate kinase
LIKVHLIERVLGHGMGLGDRKVIGRVRRLASPVPPDVAIEPDEIIVAERTDRSFLPALNRAAGLITADARPESHSRLCALEMGLPAILGVSEGIQGFEDGMRIVMDSKRGVIYERPPALWRSRDDW